MYKWNGRVAIITGASTAIGQAIVRKLVENGLTVCAIAKKSGVAKLDVSFFLIFPSHFLSLENILFFAIVGVKRFTLNIPIS